jgi:peptidoglycan/LPS O-acetylase OafA/YrhL
VKSGRQISLRSNGRFLALDGVRGIAILMVLVGHFESINLFPATGLASKVLKAILWSGLRGVDLFFVLSGFLITGILLDTRSSTNRALVFYARRMLRILPLYYVALTASIAWIALWGSASLRLEAPSTVGWASYFVYLNPLWMPIIEPHRQLAIFRHFWTLAIEEQFYLLWPACVWFIRPSRLGRVCAALAAFAVVLRMVLDVYHPASPLLAMFPTRMDSLLAGAFCAILVREKWKLPVAKNWILRAGAVAAVALGIIMIWVGRSSSTALRYRGDIFHSLGLALLAIVFGSLVLWAYLHANTGDRVDRTLCSPVLRAFGRYSYGIYVLHWPLYWISSQLFHPSPIRTSLSLTFLFAAGLMATSLLLAVVSYHLFESKFLELKRFFIPLYAIHETVPVELSRTR